MNYSSMPRAGLKFMCWLLFCAFIGASIVIVVGTACLAVVQLL